MLVFLRCMQMRPQAVTRMSSSWKGYSSSGRPWWGRGEGLKSSAGVFMSSASCGRSELNALTQRSKRSCCWTTFRPAVAGDCRAPRALVLLGLGLSGRATRETAGATAWLYRPEPLPVTSDGRPAYSGHQPARAPASRSILYAAVCGLRLASSRA